MSGMFLITTVVCLFYNIEWLQVHFMRSVKKVADRLRDGSGDSRHVFVSLGYAVLDAETKDEVEMLLKVLCGEGALETVSKFLPRSAQVLQYMGKHNPAHWSKCKT